MSIRRLVATAAAMAAIAVALAALTPPLPAMADALAAPQRTVDTQGADVLISATVGLLAWAVWAWGALGLTLTAASALPGLMGGGGTAGRAGRPPRRRAAQRGPPARVGARGRRPRLGVAWPALAPAASAAASAGADVPDWPAPTAEADPVPDWPTGTETARRRRRPRPPRLTGWSCRGDCLWHIAADSLLGELGRLPDATARSPPPSHAWWTRQRRRHRPRSRPAPPRPGAARRRARRERPAAPSHHRPPARTREIPMTAPLRPAADAAPEPRTAPAGRRPDAAAAARGRADPGPAGPARRRRPPAVAPARARGRGPGTPAGPQDDFGPTWSSRAELPDPRDAGRRLITLTLEALAGRRPLTQLQPMTSPGVFAALSGGRRPRLVRRRARRRCWSGGCTCPSRSTASPRSAPSPAATAARTPWPPGWRASTAAGAAPPCRSAEHDGFGASSRSGVCRLRSGRTPSGVRGAASGSAAGCPVAELVLLARAAGARARCAAAPWCRSPSRSSPPWPRRPPSASRPASAPSSSGAPAGRGASRPLTASCGPVPDGFGA